jgi:choline kinase
MVVHRRPGELQAELPAAVYAVDLDKLSDLLGIREDELVCGIHSKRAVSEIHGVVVDIGEDVPFESVGNIEEHKRLIPSFGEKTLTHPRVSRKGVKQVLLTAAARPGTLDSDDLPKCLIQLGSQPIIGHILTQLYASGIERVVISVAAGGEKIIQAVKQSRFYSKMNIEFLDLGPNNRDGHARSILAARNYFPKGPFLIHTSDHIFDKSIISKLLNYQLNENVACVLVETDISGLVGLPSTSVRVQLGREYVRRISRDLVQYDGIDAGLFLSSTAIFDALNDLAAKKEYFSLADALSYFTKFNKLTYVPTSGETWFSIETKEQLAYTKDQDGSAILSPWTVFLACAPEIPPGPSLTTKSMVIGVTAAETDTSLRVARQQDDTVMFDGFIVGVNNGDSMNEASISENDMQIEVIDDSTPLLSKRSVETGAGIMSSGKSLLKNPSFIDRSEINESFILSFPMDEEISRTIDSISATHRAFLIEMAPEPSTPVSSNSHFMLAVSGKEALDATPKKELGL